MTTVLDTEAVSDCGDGATGGGCRVRNPAGCRPRVEFAPSRLFQVPVDGWLTKLSDPIVIYSPDEMLGLRAPWDIPIEDFGFGFAMVTLAILLWRRWLDRRLSSQEAIDGDHDHDEERRGRLRRGRTSL